MKFEDLIPVGKSGDWSIVKKDNLIILNQKFQGNEVTWMTNLVWEQGYHRDYLRKVRGDVLLAGLGLGYDVWLVKNMEKVKSVTVVECEYDVIDLVWKHVKNNKSKIIHDRILNYMKNTDKRYDFIFFDIFQNDPGYFPKETDILTIEGTRILRAEGEIMFFRLMPEMEL